MWANYVPDKLCFFIYTANDVKPDETNSMARLYLNNSFYVLNLKYCQRCSGTSDYLCDYSGEYS